MHSKPHSTPRIAPMVTCCMVCTLSIYTLLYDTSRAYVHVINAVIDRCVCVVPGVSTSDPNIYAARYHAVWLWPLGIPNVEDGPAGYTKKLAELVAPAGLVPCPIIICSLGSSHGMEYICRNANFRPWFTTYTSPVPNTKFRACWLGWYRRFNSANAGTNTGVARMADQNWLCRICVIGASSIILGKNCFMVWYSIDYYI